MFIQEKEITLKNGKKIILRSPTSVDAQKILDHLKITFCESYKNMNHPPNHWDTVSVADEEKILTDFSTSSSKFMISAFDGNYIVGNLGCFGMGGEFLKHNARLGMGLNKEFHNLGLGTEILKYGLQSAKENGLQRIELTVRTFNQSGIHLYEKVGFRRVGILKETALIDGEYCDEYFYEILLSAMA